MRSSAKKGFCRNAVTPGPASLNCGATDSSVYPLIMVAMLPPWPPPLVEPPPVPSEHVEAAATSVSPSITAPAVRFTEPSPSRSAAPQEGHRTSRANAWHEHDGQAMSTVPIPMRAIILARAVSCQHLPRYHALR